jgi:hypothetical protein
MGRTTAERLVELPSHRDWPQLLGTLRTILRWTQQEELQSTSDYLRASSARQLLDRIRPELAFAGHRKWRHSTVIGCCHQGWEHEAQ